MEKLNPWKFGMVLALTVGFNYVLCTIFWTIWTEPSIDFLNALFHGLDFRKLQSGAPFSLGNSVFALVVFMAWIYAVGAIYALVRNRLQPNAERV